MRLTVCLEGNTEGRVLASVDMEEILKQCKENSISKEAFEKMKSECDKYLDCDSCLEDKIREHDKQIKAEVIDSINDNIHEIYKCQFYCMADMCEHDSPTVDMCIDCFYDAIQKSLEQLKERNNDK